MRTISRGRTLVASLLAAALCVVCPPGGRLGAQDASPVATTPAVTETFGPTLDFGTGLITIPTAWISPRTEDFYITVSGVRIPSSVNVTGNPLKYWNSNGSIDTHWLGRFDVGFSLYSNNPDWGFFGQVLAVKDGQFFKWMPAVAVGMRNLGPYDHEDRYLIGHDITINAAGSVNGFTPIYFDHFHTTPTVYVVATKSFVLPVPIPSTVSVTAGEGDGLFSEDGGLGKVYNANGTVATGFFFGFQGTTHPSPDWTVSLLGENNGFDYNFGGRFDWRGLGIGLYGMELEEGGTHVKNALYVYNYKKVSIAFSYRGNFRDISHGVVLRSQITELVHQQQLLRVEVAKREKRIQELQVSLNKLQGTALTDVDRQRQALEAQLKEEQDAIRRANERLQQLQQGQKPQ